MINIIHKTFPQFGNATTEQELIVEVMHAKARFAKDIKVIIHPKYYDDCFKYPSLVTIDDNMYRQVAGIDIELSKEVDTYVLEFNEKE
ncbi:hypothetical protein NXG04_07505 [Klebsiella pneumoniae]|nr:hypothetical protein [Klebsiella pneumoniae]MDS7714399.1 hypothetical protein [Klebsiella pneumoniae]